MQLVLLVMARHRSGSAPYDLHPQCAGNAGLKETSGSYKEQGLEFREKRIKTPTKGKKRDRMEDSGIAFFSKLGMNKFRNMFHFYFLHNINKTRGYVISTLNKTNICD